MPVDQCSLGQAIRDLRVLRGMTQGALASSAGLAANSIAVIERGERAVSMESLNAISEALSIPAGCLILMGTTHLAGSEKSARLVGKLQQLILATVEAQAAAESEKAAKGLVKPREGNPGATSRETQKSRTRKQRTASS